jgi:ribA/ribD-fused uncharacterized protein
MTYPARNSKPEHKIVEVQQDRQEIRFYRSNEKPYGAFSNLYKRPIEFEGRVYPTAEHAYQAGKARKEAVREWILSAPTPSLLAMAAHGLYTWDVAPDWSQNKFDRMRRVLRAKFIQHEDLQDLLLSTGDLRLVEVGRVDNEVNRVWGEVRGKGLNMLGVLLMELRADLREDGTRRSDKAPNGAIRKRGLERSSGPATHKQTRTRNGSIRQSLQRGTRASCKYV